jgi:hypothetical protein
MKIEYAISANKSPKDLIFHGLNGWEGLLGIIQ